MNATPYWGEHLILDIAGCDLALITCEENIREFVQVLIERIKMEAAGEPNIAYLLPGHPNEGYSFTQLITTSSITGHFINSNCSAYLDIFSCKNIDIEVAKQVVMEYFAPTRIRTTFLTRQADV